MSQPSEATYFTFVGSQDPWPSPHGSQQGPALDLLDALCADGLTFSEVLLAWTPDAPNGEWPGGYDGQKAELRRQMQERLPGVQVREVPVRVRPNAAAELVPVVAGALERHRHGGRVLHVNTSSGTPQMLEALKLLRGTGWFADGGVTLWQVDRPTHRQPGTAFHREATTPFLEEALKLAGAFAALRRFDFAGAQDAFGTLGSSEVPGRDGRVQALTEVSGALYALDARDVETADDILRGLKLPVPPVDGLERALREAGASREAALWLTWARFDRAAAQERVADALIWAVILREAVVAALLARRGIQENAQQLRRAQLPEVWEAVMRASPELQAKTGGKPRLFIRDMEVRLLLLRTGVFSGGEAAFVDALDDERHPLMADTAERRNRVIHQGLPPEHDWLADAQAAVGGLLAAYPFELPLHQRWQRVPRATPMSAAALGELVSDLQAWLG